MIPLYELISPAYEWTNKNIFIRYWNKIPFGNVKLLFQAKHIFGFNSSLAIDNVLLDGEICKIESE